MSTPQDIMARRARRVRKASRVLAIAALSAAIPLCTALAILFGIVFYPNCNGCIPVRETLTLPITGWPALVLQQGPVVLIVMALFSLLLVGIARGLKRQSQAIAAAGAATATPPKEPDAPSETPPKESAPPMPAAPLPALADAALLAYLAGSPIAPLPGKPKLWRRPISMAVIVLVLAALMLCALAPLSSEVFNDIGEIDLTSVSMVSANEGWAVGRFILSAGGERGVIWHYHNGQWTSMLSPAKDGLTGVSALPDGDAWAVGNNGTVLHEHGGTWTQVASDTTDDLDSIAMISPTEGWAVGGDFPTAFANNRFASDSLFGPAVALQPRDFNYCRILHYTAGRWSPVNCPEASPIGAIGPLESVAVLPDGEAWAVGYGGVILYERQGVWKQVSSPNAGLTSIALVSATDGWAVGEHGVIWHEQDGVWSPASQTTSENLDGVAVTSMGEGWIVGSEGIMLHETQGSWAADGIPAVTTNDYLYSVALLPGGQEGWAVGADQLILHLHNGVWSLYSRQASSKLPN